MRHVLLFALTGCMGAGAVELGGEPWPLPDDLFHQDPHWLGGDTGATIDLADGRTLWLFGDSYIATSANRTRRESRLVANSIAVMSGRDPATATLDFEWRGGLEPGAYFPDVGEHRLRPMSGVRITGTDPDGRGGPLVIFLAEVDRDEVVVGTRAVRITNLPQPPAEWIVEPLALPPPAFALDAAVGSCGAIEGDHYVALSVDWPDGNARVVRWPLASLAAGDLGTREWHTRDGWRTEAALVARPPEMFQGASIHCSFSRGLSATTYDEGLFWTYMQADHDEAFTREARELSGPYSIAYELLWIESDVKWNRDPDVPVISAQHHAGLTPASYHGLATYVPTSANPDDLLDPVLEHALHWPHFLRLMPVVTAVE